MPELPPSNLSRVPSGTDVRDLGREINKVIEALNTVCGIVRSLSRFDRPNAPPPHFPSRSISPLQTVGVNGVAATITGSYSSATPYLWFNIGANTAEWKSSTLAPFPLDTIILDGRAGYGSEYWHMR